MTRKKIYPQPLTAAHTQTFSLRQAPSGITPSDVPSDRGDDRYSRTGNNDWLAGSGQSGDREPAKMYHALYSPADGTGPATMRADPFPDALSPNSVVTPSETSNAPSTTSTTYTRKRAWTDPDNEILRVVKPNRGMRSDLAGLLNPVPEPSPVQSPVISVSDMDKGSYLVAHIANTLQTDVLPDSDPGPPQTPGGFRLPELKPKPVGYYHHAGNREGAEDNPNDTEEQKKKGRKGPLESDQRRKEVLEVRELGACLRCHIMRIRCNAVALEACTNCRETLPKSRKWTVPCTREWLKTRYKYLLPALLVKRNDLKEIVPDIASKNLGETIQLPMTHYSTLKFSLEVQEILDPSQVPTILAHYFTDQKGEDPSATISLDKHHAPPFVPLVRPGRDPQIYAVQLMTKHLEEQMKDLSRTWILDVFPWGKSESWPRDVLNMVIHYSREVSRSPALNHGLRSCLIRFLMNYAFYIPFPRMTEVNHLLSSRNRLSWNQVKRMEDEQEMWSPTIVNKWLKSALLKMLEHLLMKFFSELEGLFKLQETSGDQAKLSDLDRDEAFCAIIVSFIVIGMMQTKLLILARVVDEESNDPDRKETEEAKRCIQKQETEVVDHILQLWKYRFCKSEMKAQPAPDRVETAQKSKNFEVIAWFEKLKNSHADSLYGLEPTLNLNPEKQERFMTQNISRLLLRLSDALWKPRSQR